MSPPSVSVHQKSADPSDVDDPVEGMLKKTGCIQLHHKIQDCIVFKQDWRQCQKEVQEFRECMAEYTKKQQEHNSKQV
ncbi:Hypothetical predicted protein [Cloeon dipterum]|uniref:CHCH domain-containing protein n=1 Tax=Cloeon dipterum TaxID=197152 RepID=A0A8S1CKK6_9INSE|nr:Hypothetical predicted protein [Cloeon dipterum]